jgi:hypothetical protein
MTHTILQRGQAVGNALYDLEVLCQRDDVPQDIRDAVEVMHDRLDKLRRTFGVDLVEPSEARGGAIAFSGGTSKQEPTPPPPPPK